MPKQGPTFETKSEQEVSGQARNQKEKEAERKEARKDGANVTTRRHWPIGLHPALAGYVEKKGIGSGNVLVEEELAARCQPRMRM